MEPRAPWALDLDGVVWRGSEAIPGAAEAIGRLRAAGHRVAFVTNNSGHPVAAVETKLAHHGIPAEGDVITSAMAAATLIQPGERVLVCGGPGLVEAVQRRGAEAVTNAGSDPGVVDAVLCGYWGAVTYDRIRWAATSVHRGARLLASNDDATYPSSEGILPGGGATLAAVERASGVTAVVAGKPNAPMAELVRDELGEVGTMVGDRLDTDGGLARALGWPFVLVLSGVTVGDEEFEPEPDSIAPDLAAAVRRALS